MEYQLDYYINGINSLDAWYYMVLEGIGFQPKLIFSGSQKGRFGLSGSKVLKIENKTSLLYEHRAIQPVYIGAGGEGWEGGCLGINIIQWRKGGMSRL